MSQASVLTITAVALAGLAAGAFGAETSPTPELQPPSYQPPVLDPNFVAPKISQEYAHRLTGLPDWTGSWFLTGGYLFDPANSWMPINNDEAFDTGPLEGSIVRNIPYKPEYQKQYEDTVANAVQGVITDPVGACQQPHGMPRELGGVPGGPEIIILPNQVRMTYYWFNATRRIYTDGRPHPTGVDLVPTFMGHSIGKWEGDTLVTDTVGMNPGIYDRTGAPHSGEVHVMERIRLVAPDLLEDQITIEDPVMLTKPWRVTRYLRRMSRVPQSEGAYCEGGRIDMSSGAQRIILPDERAAEESPQPGKGFWRRLFGN
jgi:hypothetical protein